MANAVYAPTSDGLLAPLKPWFDDALVSEIMLNKPGEVFIEKEGVIECHRVPEYNERMLNNLFQLIANENRQTLSAKTPLLSGSLQDGSRIQLVLPPAAQYHTFSIRRKVVKNIQSSQYVKDDYFHQIMRFDIDAASFENLPETEQSLVRLYHDAASSKDWHAFIVKAIELKKNIVISGGTSSGKTTFLNAYLKHIDAHDRVITLEDTREIEIPHPNQISLLASKGDQGLANVSMQDLVQCCLRLRPDRIIMGEIRGKEIMDFVSACSTGHEGSLTTIHANNPRVAFMRMIQMYKQNNVPSMTDADIRKELEEVIDIIIQVNKTPTGRMAHSIYYKYMHLQPKKKQQMKKTKKTMSREIVA